MKWFLWLLLAANLLLLVWFNLPIHSPVELQFAQPQLQPEKIRLLSPEEIESLPKRVPEPQMDPVPEITLGCYEWGSFSRGKLASARKFLSNYPVDVTIRPQTSAESRRFWVYIPRLPSAEAAQEKAEELKALGVVEIFVVQEQQFRNAISLGVFKDEQLATKLLAELKNKGVDTAVKGVRNQESGRASLYIANVSQDIVSEIEKLYPEYPGSELKPVTCEQEPT